MVDCQESMYRNDEMNKERIKGASQVDDGKKKGSTIGRFLRNLGIRKSGRKNAYKQQQGDLMAYEITMSDEDRMALMQMVKEGKISTETAVSVVKQFEEEQRRRMQEDEGKENFAGLLGSPSGKKGTLKKKKSGSKPSKSQSSGYTGISPTDGDQPQAGFCDHPMSGICCRQRRVHSISHIDQPQGISSPSFSRALSCSPTRTNTPFNSPFGAGSYQFQTSSAAAAPQPQPAPKLTTFGHVETLKERLTGNKGKSSSHPTKTSSQTSLLSSSSEQSMDCNLQLLPLKPEVVGGREQEGGGDGGGSNSNMSTGSDYSPAPAAIASDSTDKVAKAKTDSQFRATAPRPPLLRQSSATTALYNSAAHAGAFIALARAKVDFTPPEGDTDSLAYKKGDIIHIMATTPGGHGRGAMHGVVGGFLLANVETLSMPQYNKPPPRHKAHKNSCKPKPRSVEELMSRIGLEQLAKVFIDNGFDTLEIFSEIDERDLTTLGILQPEQRAKLLTAAELLLDSDSPDSSDGQVPPTVTERSAQPGVASDTPSSTLSPSVTLHPSLDGGASGKGPTTASHDAGCFAGGEQMKKMMPRLQEGGASAGMAVPSKCLCRQCGKPKPQGGVGGELSAEDQEVFSITVGSQRPSTAASTTTTTTTTTLAAPPTCSVCTHPATHSQSRCESKSSKQSLSSACTQLTSLSPEEEVGGYDGRHSHSHHAHDHSHRVLTGQWDAACVQCAQEAALLTSKMAGQDSPSRTPQQQSIYPYLGYGGYEGYAQYPDCQSGGGVVGAGGRSSGRRTPSSMHYGMPGGHYGSAVQHSHYASSHYRSHYTAHSAHYGSSTHPQVVYYGSQSAHYYPTHHYASQAPYGGMAAHYRSAASAHYGGSQAGGQQHSPVTLSLSASSTSPSQPAVSLKLNRSVSHEGGSLYPACASPRGPDYGQGATAKATRSPTRSLIPLVKTKLSAEGIILTDEPYSTPVVQRYAEELRLDVMSIALLLEQVRTLQLHALQRPCVPNELLADDCRKACNLQISSLAEFFISIGLPMYIPRILAGGVTSVQQMLAMTDADIPRLTGADSYHVKRISHAIQWVKAKLNSPTQGSTTSSTSSDGKSGGGGGGGGSSSGTKQNSGGSVKDKV
ncbi:uncharacterized protein LOC143283477 [Babylonia areolata]|uniref:uncharacterized protein LOC143283477 n=1 Tax=Babylonia areolata TaxID=304850 RepID=UPI003FD255E3